MEAQKSSGRANRASTSRESGKLSPISEEGETRRELNLSSFGDASLAFMGVTVANGKQIAEIMKRTGNRKYVVKSDGRENFTIGYEHDDTFTIALFNKSRWVTNLRIDQETLHIGNIGQARLNEVAIRQTTKKEDRRVHALFTLKNASDIMLKRLDVRGYSTQWFSVFTHGADLLVVRPNGDWLEEKMQYLTDQLNTQAVNNYRRSNGQDVLPAQRTAVMQRRRLAQQVHQNSATQTDGDDGRVMALIKSEKLFEQHSKVLQENWRQLQAKGKEYEQEMARLSVTEERVNRLREEEQHYAQRKAVLAQEIINIGSAGNELVARRERLKEESASFKEEQESHDRLTKERIARMYEEDKHYVQRKNELLKKIVEVGKLDEELVARRNTLKGQMVDRTDGEMQTEMPLWTAHCKPMISLNERFTEKRSVRSEDGMIKIVLENINFKETASGPQNQ